MFDVDRSLSAAQNFLPKSNIQPQRGQPFGGVTANIRRVCPPGERFSLLGTERNRRRTSDVYFEYEHTFVGVRRMTASRHTTCSAKTCCVSTVIRPDLPESGEIRRQILGKPLLDSIVTVILNVVVVDDHRVVVVIQLLL